MGDANARQGWNIFWMNAPANSQVICHPTHIQLVRQGNMQGTGYPLSF